MEDKVWETIMEKHTASGGHNGSYAARIKNQLNIPYSELRKILNRLYKEKKIILKDGSQGKLIFPNVNIKR